MSHHKKKIICLMGPTAAGKTPLAISLVQQLPCEIISVDSVMIYRGMNIGTAKPTADILKIAPHRLIDLCDPSEVYSAGQFHQDAIAAIDDIMAQGKIPLLVGGTMLYFRLLQQGLAELPQADSAVRQQIQLRAEQAGWEKLYDELKKIDSLAASHIHPHDSQRIQRALEVFLLTGKPISAWQKETHPLENYQVINIALCPQDRVQLHERIAKRFKQMLADGFIDEVKTLFARKDLSPTLPAMRAVGYRQAWAYLAGEISEDEMISKAIAATRQLAKRQITWLRSWREVNWIDAEADDAGQQVMKLIGK